MVDKVWENWILTHVGAFFCETQVKQANSYLNLNFDHFWLVQIRRIKILHFAIISQPELDLVLLVSLKLVQIQFSDLKRITEFTILWKMSSTFVL